jgi:hypothetical protein
MSVPCHTAHHNLFHEIIINGQDDAAGHGEFCGPAKPGSALAVRPSSASHVLLPRSMSVTIKPAAS